MTAVPSARPATRVPRSTRAAQVLLLLPLGLAQLAAAVTFTIVLRPTALGDLAVAAWAIVMSSACAVVAVRLGRSAVAARLALGLLVAQAAFSVVKLTVYREPESLVFMTITVGAALLLLPAVRRPAVTSGRVGRDHAAPVADATR